METDSLFAPARDVRALADCYFYHVMELPGYGMVGSEWDLRGGEDAYLGKVNVQGKRVLEIGTASGFLCRYMESRGADVIGFDLSADRSYDLVPFAGSDISSMHARLHSYLEKLKNGWWLAHRVFGSHAQALYGNIYSIPETLGQVDIATFGAVLLHLRDPFQALASACRLTRETVIVTEVHPEQPHGSGLGSFLPRPPTTALGRWWRRASAYPCQGLLHPGRVYFVPQPGEANVDNALSWWSFPHEVICRFIGVLGFTTEAVTEHFQTYYGKKTRLYTVVGKRTRTPAR
jgi:hypothetical protein